MFACLHYKVDFALHVHINLENQEFMPHKNKQDYCITWMIIWTLILGTNVKYKDVAFLCLLKIINICSSNCQVELAFVTFTFLVHVGV